jgi:hypothetical protein
MEYMLKKFTHVMGCNENKTPKASEWSYYDIGCEHECEVCEKCEKCEKCKGCKNCGGWMGKSAKKGDKYIGIVCDYVNDVEVLDLDIGKDGEKSGVEWFEENVGKVEDQDTLVVRTPSGGYHIYYKYEEIFENKTKLINGVSMDYRSMGKGYVCFGQGYEIRRMGEIKKMPEDVKEKIKEGKINKTQKKENDNKFKYNIDEIRYMIRNLSKEQSDDYDTWIGVLFCCKNIGGEIFKEDFEFFSKKSKKHEKKVFESKWNQDIKQGYGYKQLKKYFNESLETKDDDTVKSSQRSRVSKLSDFTDAGSVKKFFNKYKHLMVSCKGKLWMKDFTNEWVSNETQVAHILISFVSEEYNIGADNYNNMMTILKSIAYKEVRDDKFDEFENIGIICFKNGYYDFNEGRFRSWTDLTYY